ncbi:MAG: hypothetical protein MI919_13985 [Holophagales bacterium]|nr:hypothetical protein [Holophagales bacterium]
MEYRSSERSPRPVTSLAVAIWPISIFLALAAPGPLFADRGEEGIGGPEIDTEVLERGAYSIRLRGMVAAPARELLAVLLDYGAQCSAGCRYTVPGISSAQILDRRGEAGTKDGLEMLTWTFIDDVLDASYFSRIRVVSEPAKIQRPAGQPAAGAGSGDGAAGVTVVRFGTPDASEIERWSSAERRHEPFFHHVSGSWTLEEAGSREDSFTRVEMVMEMRSDRFLVNLLPARVLDGSRDHFAALFGHLRDLERPIVQSAPGQGSIRPPEQQ